MSDHSVNRSFLNAAAALLVFGSLAVAQSDRCQEFRALSQMVFDATVGTYVGPIFASLDSEVLIDLGTPPQPAVRPPVTTCRGGVCTDRDAQYRIDFGNGNTLTYEVMIASYKEPPTFATYRSTNKIVAGTGRFKTASGVLLESGPFFAWVDAKGQLQARYSGELSGRICNVEPKQK